MMVLLSTDILYKFHKAFEAHPKPPNLNSLKIS